MSLENATIIIADDLTGANDTAAQYFRSGKKTKILIGVEQEYLPEEHVEVWAISTESRNITKENAADRVVTVCKKFQNELGIDNFYKKIDSTLRGNVGVEIIAALSATNKDAAVIVPAYIEENRTTIGAYQLLNGVALERTQMALDPKAPIFESYIPDILKKDLNSNYHSLIDTIGLNVVSKGAAPIISKIKELIEKNKKLIVIDAMSTTDIEQIAFAINKCGYNILPCGSAGLANALNKISKNTASNSITHIPNLPRLIISGSATQLSANQIAKLKSESKNIYSIDLKIQDIINPVCEENVEQIINELCNGKDVLIHSSDINKEIASEEAENILIDAGIAKNEFPTRITDYLSDIVKLVNSGTDFILVTVGGETSYKCIRKMESKYLEMLDTIMPAIPLCIDSHGKIIVTKSGNFGANSTLVDIINYFEMKK